MKSKNFMSCYYLKFHLVPFHKQENIFTEKRSHTSCKFLEGEGLWLCWSIHVKTKRLCTKKRINRIKESKSNKSVQIARRTQISYLKTASCLISVLVGGTSDKIKRTRSVHTRPPNGNNILYTLIEKDRDWNKRVTSKKLQSWKLSHRLGM